MIHSEEQFVVNTRGEKTGVIIPITKYQKLLEDLHDLAVIAERRQEEPIPVEELIRQLDADDNV
jgi:hypothetical protein